MTKEERSELLLKINEKIIQAQAEIAHLEETTKPIAPENSLGRISRMDAINNKGVAEAALRSSQKKLNKLKLASSMIDQAGFGKCTMCKNKIATARLMYMPESQRCINCADRK